jgi:hypothetical protein
MSVIETVDVIEPWMYQRLAADAALTALVAGRVVSTMAGRNMQSPYVVFDLNSPRDIRGIGTGRIMVDCLYVAKAVGKTDSWDDLAPIAARVDELLDGASGEVVAGHVLGVARERVVQYAEVDDNGNQYRHLGGMYRLWAHAQ